MLIIFEDNLGYSMDIMLMSTSYVLVSIHAVHDTIITDSSSDKSKGNDPRDLQSLELSTLINNNNLLSSLIAKQTILVRH